MITLYGINNCTTVKKAIAWLEEHDIEHSFHDYKTQGVDESILNAAFDAHGWEKTLNRASMTWRALPDDLKNTMNRDSALKAALEKPSVIRRPLLVINEDIYLGFRPETYKKIFED